MDMACNMRFDNRSSFRCHGNLDYVLTPTGDIGTISGEYNLLKQHILIWASTPLGEDPDPNCGCVLHKYTFGKATSANLRKVEQELVTNLQYNFPEFTITGVRAIDAYDALTNTHGIAVTALFNLTEVSFFTNTESLLELWKEVRQSLGSLAYMTDAKP